jgi:GNAT superfamily N-acetyltransferase
MDEIDRILYRYEPGQETDLLLATWWAKLHTTGDLFAVFPTSIHNLSNFLVWFRPPRELAYAMDGEGIWLAAWFEPVFSGAIMGLWVDPRYRRSRHAAELVGRLYDEALSRYPVLLGVTGQRRLLRAYVKAGYEVLGSVPYLFDGEEGWMLVLTRQAFENSWWFRRRAVGTDQRARHLH